MRQGVAARASMGPAIAHRLAPVKARRDAAGMSRERINRICKAMPGAKVSDPWGGGHDAWKVGGKMFAVIGAVNEVLSVKTDGVETAEMLIEAGLAAPAKYMHRSWVSLPLDAPEDELRHRIKESYRVIRGSLPKKMQAALSAPP